MSTTPFNLRISRLSFSLLLNSSASKVKTPLNMTHGIYPKTLFTGTLSTIGLRYGDERLMVTSETGISLIAF